PVRRRSDPGGRRLGRGDAVDGLLRPRRQEEVRGPLRGSDAGVAALEPRDERDHAPAAPAVPPVPREALAAALRAGGMDRNGLAWHAGGFELGGVDGPQVEAEAAAAARAHEIAGELHGGLASDPVAARADRGAEPRPERPGLGA